MNTILIIGIITIFISVLIILNSEPSSTPLSVKTIDVNGSNPVQEFYRCVQEGLISEEDISVKFVIDLSRQILNRLNKEIEAMNIKMNETTKKENLVNDETSKLIEALSKFEEYEDHKQEVTTINVENKTLEKDIYKEENIIIQVADVIPEIVGIIKEDKIVNNNSIIIPKPGDISIKSDKLSQLTKAYACNVYKNNGSDIKNTLNLYA